MASRSRPRANGTICVPVDTASSTRSGQRMGTTTRPLRGTTSSSTMTRTGPEGAPEESSVRPTALVSPPACSTTLGSEHVTEHKSIRQRAACPIKVSVALSHGEWACCAHAEPKISAFSLSPHLRGLHLAASTPEPERNPGAKSLGRNALKAAHRNLTLPITSASRSS